jgi:aminoglycoside phosphotransferase family enzyme/predicted kinase
VSERAGSPEPLPEGLVECLHGAQAYPHDPSALGGVEVRQTHISWLFLTPERVYKLRKAVDLGFVRFPTRAERNLDCEREVALNRRLAPDVYLGVAPVHLEGGRARVGPVSDKPAEPDARGDLAEHCVVMRRLSEERCALALLERKALGPAEVDAIAERIAGFHAENCLDAPAPFEPEEWLERIRRPVETNFEALEGAPRGWLPRRTLAGVEEETRRLFDLHRERFEARRRAGRAVDGHGDLHLAHVWIEREGSEPLAIDCIEFREDLRRIDGASDVAFLALDLAARRRPKLGERLLRRYAAETDDWDLYSVVDWYRAYRACVRAKVAVLTAQDDGGEEAARAERIAEARRYLRLAARALESRAGAALILTCGPIGSGRSSAAEVVSETTGAPCISADRVRRRIVGSAPDGTGEARERAELGPAPVTDAVYAGLLERADLVLRSGRPVVLDAVFATAARRARALAFAREHGVPVLLVEARCAPGTALERLSARRREAPGVPHAGPELLRESRRAFAPPDEWPADAALAVWTDARDWRPSLRSSERLRRLGASAR